MKSKTKKIIIISISSLLALTLLIAYILVFPLFGKKHLEVWAASDKFDINTIESVEKNPDKPFKILQLSDLQLWMKLSDNKKTLKMVEDIIAQEKPDLVVLAGDNVSGLTTNYLVRQVIKTLDKTKTPWAPVFGNHDGEGKATLNWQGDRYLESEYCLFKKGPSNLYGVGNYVVNVTENGSPIQSLFLMDNGRYMQYTEEMKKEVYIGYEQMAWYKWNVEGVKSAAGKTVPSMVFTHFAMPEMKAAIEKYGIKDETTKKYTLPKEYGFGTCQYLPGVAPVNSGFLDLCKELGSTKYFFCGHDHENDMSITADGFTMTFGLKTGPSPAPWNDAERYGGTLITIGNADTNYKVDINHVVMSEVSK